MPDTITIPVEGEGVEEMAEPSAQFERLHDQNMAAMGQAIVRFQNDASTVSKATDYAYLQELQQPSSQPYHGFSFPELP